MAETNAENPSMDDILNTIRGVIAGDEESAAKEGQPTDAAPAEVSAQEAESAAPESVIEEGQKQEAEENVSAKDEPAAESTEEDDILELTELIEDGDAMSEAPATAPEEENNSEGLLDDIDNMIESQAAEDAPASDAAPAEAPPADVPAEEVSAAAEVPATEETAPPVEASEADVPAEEAMITSPEPAAEEVAQETAPEPESVAEEVPVAEEVAPEPIAQPEVEAPTASVASDRLLSEAAAATSQAVLKDMMHAIPRQKVDSPATRGGTTLEDLVIEAIRPYLAEWMDKHLATIVKQLVEKEIKHLIPRDVE